MSSPLLIPSPLSSLIIFIGGGGFQTFIVGKKYESVNLVSDPQLNLAMKFRNLIKNLEIYKKCSENLELPGLHID